MPASPHTGPALYKWKDAKGGVHVTDTPPTDRPYETLRYDPNEAKRLLAEAGHANGVEFEYMFATVQFGQQQQIDAIQPGTVHFCALLGGY